MSFRDLGHFTLSPANRIIKIKNIFSYEQPFLSYIAFNLRFEEDEQIPAPIALRGDGMVYYNPKQLYIMHDDELETLIASCSLKIALKHLLRKGPRNPVIWDAASNIVVDYILRDMQFHSLWLDQTFATKSVETVYEMLKSGTPIPSGMESEKSKILHIYTLTDDQVKELDGKWQQIADDAIGYSHGLLPAALARAFNILPPKLDWRTVLDEFVVAQIPVDFSWKKISPKSLDKNYRLPDMVEEGMKAIVGIDTSGSVSEKELNRFASELTGLVDQYPSIELIIIPADAAISNIYYDFESFLKDKKLGGGGGTDFRPIVSWATENANNAILIYITDGEGSFPEKVPNFPVLWVLSKRHTPIASIPFGKIVVMEGDD
jgi:predicted metal-dependent peptidase